MASPKKKREMSGKDDVLYGLGEDEVLHKSVDDAIITMFDGVAVSFDTLADEKQWPLKVYVYRRKTFSEGDKALQARRAINWMLDDLDETCGDNDGTPTEPTEAMREAAKTFVEAVCREYVPWACERTGEVIEVTRDEARKMVEGEA